MALQVDALTAIMSNGQDELQQVPAWMWRRISCTLLGDQHWEGSKSQALHVAAATCCWFEQHVLDIARHDIWRFCAGDTVANAAALRSAHAADLDPVCLQLRHLQNLGMVTYMEVASALA